MYRVRTAGLTAFALVALALAALAIPGCGAGAASRPAALGSGTASTALPVMYEFSSDT